jgi:hypothetical protein
LLGPTVGVSVVLAVCGLAVWGAALWFSWSGECPGAGSGGEGLGNGVAVWPPAAECVDRHGNAFWHQALPWATWVVVMLIAVAALTLLVGLIVAIRDLLRPSAASESPSLGVLEASYAHEGHPRPPARDERGRERDPPAIAA